MFRQLVGNAAFKAQAGTAITAGRLPSAVLICGEDGLGRSLAARLLALNVLAPEKAAAFPLGTQSGKKADKPMAKTAKPAAKNKEPAKQETLVLPGLQILGAGGEKVKAAEVREMRSSLGHTSIGGEKRVVIIENAHTLNATAANAMLKIIEEPPAGVHFVLTATGTGSVLPTILSRCSVYPLAPVTRGECEGYLKTHFPAADAQLLYAVFGGRIGFCKLCAENESANATLSLALTACAAIAAGDEYKLLVTLSALEGQREQAVQFLTFLQHAAFGGVLRAENGKIPPLLPESGTRVINECTKAANAFAANANIKLALANFALGSIAQ